LSSHDQTGPRRRPHRSQQGPSGRFIPHRVRTRPRSRADPCPAERTVRLSWVEQAARDRLTPHDPTVEQQPRLPDLRRSGSYSVPFASASRGFGVLEPRYFDESGVPPDWKPGSRQVAFVVAHCGDLQIRLRQGRL